MKKEIHPQDYRMVVFKDISNDEMFLTRSCTKSRDTAGRIDKFNKKFAKFTNK